MASIWPAAVFAKLAKMASTLAAVTNGLFIWDLKNFTQGRIELLGRSGVAGHCRSGG
jgi:hypothetical protein